MLTKSPSPPSRPSSGSSPAPTEAESIASGGRERRTRKSINYAEPKLNTKMRKPDPPPGSAPPKKRVSAAAILTTYNPPSEDAGHEADNDSDARSSLEMSNRATGNVISPEMLPLPPSRPSSVLSIFSPPPPGPRSSSSLSSSSAATSIKRNKSRPHVLPDDNDDSDGTQADAEYGFGKADATSWVNVEGRRKAGNTKRTLATSDDVRRHSMAV